MLATAANLPAIAEQLRRRGPEPAELERRGLLVVADAEATLAEISADGAAAETRFELVVGALIDRVAATSPAGSVRLFGEMVDVLCRRGEPDAAAALEALWNGLAARRRVTLLCGYRLDVFDRETQVALLPQVYRAHSEVLAAGEYERLDRAVDTALAEVIGRADAQKVYALAATHGGRRAVPLAQLVLMWVSAQMPRTAERILAAARAHYVAAEAR